MDIIESLTARHLPKREGPIRAFILHNTGDTDLDAILRFYHDPDGYQPGYLIETHGAVRRIVPDDTVAYHAAIQPDEGALYAQGWRVWSRFRWTGTAAVQAGASELPRYAEWRATWRARGLDSPLNLVTGWHPNRIALGIELQNPRDPTRDLFTDEQYAALAELLAEKSAQHHVRLTRDLVLGHYDVCPLRRSNAIGNYDPGAAFKWMRLWDLLRRGALV